MDSLKTSGFLDVLCKIVKENPDLFRPLLESTAAEDATASAVSGATDTASAVPDAEEKGAEDTKEKGAEDTKKKGAERASNKDLIYDAVAALMCTEFDLARMLINKIKLAGDIEPTVVCELGGDILTYAHGRLETALGIKSGELAQWLDDFNGTIEGGAAVEAIFGSKSAMDPTKYGDVDLWYWDEHGRPVRIPPTWTKDETVLVWNGSTAYRTSRPGTPPIQAIHRVSKDNFTRFDYSYCQVSIGVKIIRVTVGALIANLHKDRPAQVGPCSRESFSTYRDMLRAIKAQRKGYTLPKDRATNLEWMLRGSQGDTIKALADAQSMWNAAIAKDPTDLVAIVAAYGPLNHGNRRLTSVAHMPACTAVLTPIKLTEYLD